MAAPPVRADSPTLSTDAMAQEDPKAKDIWECCGLPPAPSAPSPVEPFADRWNENEYRLLLWNGGGRGQ